MAHTKSQGSCRNGRDSKPKYLGVKCYAGEIVKAGTILIKQKGSHFDAGQNVGRGRDFTLFAKCSGKVFFPKSRVVTVIPQSG
jgi:large subunit ribosomal protein L27